MVVPAFQVQLLPAQERNSTWVTPERASVGAEENACKFWIVAPAAGALKVKAAGPVLSGVTVKVLLAARPEPFVAVTVIGPVAVLVSPQVYIAPYGLVGSMSASAPKTSGNSTRAIPESGSAVAAPTVKAPELPKAGL